MIVRQMLRHVGVIEAGYTDHIIVKHAEQLDRSELLV